MSEGLAALGVEHERHVTPPDDVDVAICWGWRVGKTLQAKRVLVMERGYLGDRMLWTSLGWGGLNGRAEFAPATDNGERFEQNFGHLLKPWKQDGGYALILGQVAGDQAVANVEIEAWYAEAGAAMERRGFEVRFRPHPKSGGSGKALRSHLAGGTLDEALAGAAVAVTWSSNSGVEAVLAGVPTIACDEGSMARPVAAHSLGDELVRPDRSAWCREMAWRQFTTDEIRSGFAWQHVSRVVSKRRPRSCLVLGGANTLEADIEAALDVGQYDGVIACNDAAAWWPGDLEAFVTLHPEKLGAWLKERSHAGLPAPKRVISHKQGKFVTDVMDYRLTKIRRSGSSGYFAAKVAAFDLGYDRVVLCGIPLEPSGAHFFDKREWISARKYREPWTLAVDQFADRIRSMGGWTQRLLGQPDTEWLTNSS